jgi:hypothetical protein
MIIRHISYLKHLTSLPKPPSPTPLLTPRPLTTFTRKNFSQTFLLPSPALSLPLGTFLTHPRKYFSTGGSKLPPKDFDISKVEALQRLREHKLVQDSGKHDANLQALEDKAAMLEQAKPSHDQFIFFDADIMSNIPWIFSWMTPYVDFVRTL